MACNDAKVNSNSSNSSNSSNITENDKVDYIITYTSSDGEPVRPSYDAKTPFNANIINNTYENGMGKISFDNPVTSIGKKAFSDCDRLTSITIPNSVTSIGEYAFGGCKSLTSFTIPNSVTNIGKAAFGYCSSLTSVSIPYSVTSIGEGAFRDCSSLERAAACHGQAHQGRRQGKGNEDPLCRADGLLRGGVLGHVRRHVLSDVRAFCADEPVVAVLCFCGHYERDAVLYRLHLFCAGADF